MSGFARGLGRGSSEGVAAKAQTDAATAVNTASTIVKRGAAGEVALGAINGMTFRKIASGSTSCPTAAQTSLGTFTRQAGEVVKIFQFTQENNATPSWFEGEDNGVGCWTRYQRTTNANEFTVKVGNVSGVNVTIDWVLVGIKP